MAGGLAPAVFHIAARQVGASTASIFGEHSDVMAARSTGAMLLSSCSVQEVHDNALVAHIATLRARLPVVHFFEGFQVSHEQAKIELLDYDTIAKLVPTEALAAHRARASHPTHPTVGMALHSRDTLMQTAERPNEFWDAAPKVVSQVMDDVAHVTGRPLKPFVYSGTADAEVVVVVIGAAAGAASEALQVCPRTGVLRVVLYRPWSSAHFFEALRGPLESKALKHVVVLDRCKDGGSVGEPLLLDVATAFMLSGRGGAVRVIGGRYGLGDMPFTPAMARAVFEHARSGGASGFVVGCDDDITHRSLKVEPLGRSTVPAGTRQCVLWGFGSDGTVGAVKMSAQLIADSTPLFVQGYVFFTAHKAGGITISHLRFGPSRALDSSCTYPILSGEADYVGCHHPSYAAKYTRPVADTLARGGAFVINWPGGAAAVSERLPAAMKRALAEKEARVYAVDARAVSRAAGLPGGIINVVMQCAFLKLAACDALPIDRSVELLKKAAVAAYHKKGPEVVQKNCDAIDMSLQHLEAVRYDRATWLQSPVAAPGTAGDTEWVARVKRVVDDMNGTQLPVSAFAAGATALIGNTAFDKRAIADAVPVWDAQRCVQCCTCSAVCPHAAIRPALYTADEARALPAGHPTAPAKALPPDVAAKVGAGAAFALHVSPLDCTGCGVCVSACPAKGGAIAMRPVDESAAEVARWATFAARDPHSDWFAPPTTLRMAQLRQPLLEFSSACAGCGETPHIKLLTQLFGERMNICNAPGCSSAISVTFAADPFCANADGWGPSLRAGLFENNAEFGYGMARALAAQRTILGERVRIALGAESAPPMSAELRAALSEWLSAFEAHAADAKSPPATLSADAHARLVGRLAAERAAVPALGPLDDLRDAFVNVGQWIFGGDGWAYDINSGGVDHVLSLDARVRVLVLDTEVYSNTGGQVSKATPEGGVHKFAAGGKLSAKKDFAMQVIGIGHVYVGQVSLYANPHQALRAMREADEHDGPSIVICYAPCIEHGIDGGTAKFVAHAKLATECGYWPLFRYDPSKKPALQIDSPEPKDTLHQLLDSENRFVRLVREQPERAKALQEKLSARISRRWRMLKQLAAAESGSTK